MSSKRKCKLVWVEKNHLECSVCGPNHRVILLDPERRQATLKELRDRGELEAEAA